MPRIALDVDGVLLNYHAAYGIAWERAFGIHPEIRNVDAYWPADYWCVEKLSGSAYKHFRSQFDDSLWSSIPAYDGAVNACMILNAAGYELVCVTALEQRYKEAREKNLLDAGFPIQYVICTDIRDDLISPKAAAIEAIGPVAFVDDYLPFMRGIPSDVHSALIVRGPDGSPNTGAELKLVRSQHVSIAEFTTWWLKQT